LKKSFSKPAAGPHERVTVEPPFFASVPMVVKEKGRTKEKEVIGTQLRSLACGPRRRKKGGRRTDFLSSDGGEKAGNTVGKEGKGETSLKLTLSSNKPTGGRGPQSRFATNQSYSTYVKKKNVTGEGKSSYSYSFNSSRQRDVCLKKELGHDSPSLRKKEKNIFRRGKKPTLLLGGS